MGATVRQHLGPWLTLGLMLAAGCVRMAGALKAGCKDDAGCSLNGRCVRGSCVCSAAWGGDDCGVLQLLPTPLNAGYAPARGGSSWGGIAVRDPDNASAWTLVASEFVNGCGLNDWSPNSRVVKAVSTTSSALGPYEFSAELLPPFHHNPQLLFDEDTKTWVIFAIGRTCNNTFDCHGEHPAPKQSACPIPNDPAPANMESGISAFSAPKLGGPWRRVGTEPVFGGVETPGGSHWSSWDADTTNPTAMIMRNSSGAFSKGTCVLMYRGCPKGCDSYERIGIAASADGWRGPFARHSAAAPLCARPDSSCNAEDPFIWLDSDGHYHALLHSLANPGSSIAGGKGGGFHCDAQSGHGCDVGIHAYSKDGLGWTFSTTVAFNTTVQYTDGSSSVLARRERPQIVFVDGEPAYLTNGATHNAPPPSAPPPAHGLGPGRMDAPPVQGDHSFTLIVPIQRADTHD